MSEEVDDNTISVITKDGTKYIIELIFVSHDEFIWFSVVNASKSINVSINKEEVDISRSNNIYEVTGINFNEDKILFELDVFLDSRLNKEFSGSYELTDLKGIPIEKEPIMTVTSCEIKKLEIEKIIGKFSLLEEFINDGIITYNDLNDITQYNSELYSSLSTIHREDMKRKLRVIRNSE